MEIKSLVIGIGELLWDVFPDQKKIGGAPVNFAYHVSKMGIDSLAISAIGNDELGRELLDVIDQAGVNYNIGKNEYPTGTVQVTLSGDGVPQYEICEPVAWDFIPLKPEWEEKASVASAICFGSLAQRGEVSRKSIRRLIELAHPGAFKVFDINLRQQFYSEELIRESLSLCNVLKINDEELEVVAKFFGLSRSQDDQCQTLLGQFKLELLVLTCGTNGSYLYRGSEITFKETPKVKVADTVGAGDSFTAAIVSGLLNKQSLDEMHEWAVKLSAFVCTQNGAMPDYQKEELF
ncbi:carbohydrate kinase family protein [Sunxiuqinia dokdonensis]|uniref:Fructokinase n=1 Tax=Sunxiuqinia dokdonensis TaxID=1409788 RepID=A0A0L8V5F2_9BACT|nr:carbohydrate kinase [Sunxiuqinia dokdonensis]KOH43646.1 fructokinase [Sunxiuqinia dokdonensis]